MSRPDPAPHSSAPSPPQHQSPPSAGGGGRPEGGGYGAPAHAAAGSTVSFQPEKGWHCSHFFYTFDRAKLATMPAATIEAGRRAFVATLDPAAPGAPIRLQTWIVPGHKADFAVMAIDPDPLVIDGLHQRLLAGPLGPALVPGYSFVSLTEVSEYVPTPEQFGQRLLEEGETADSPTYRAKVQGYAAREGAMRKSRIEPELPPWPNACFYPMNKKRKVGENWFTLPLAERSRLMAEHGRTGMSALGGKVKKPGSVSKMSTFIK
jgi:chlorite dismutase